MPKVIISTDIGGNDKDDGQSLIHALLYADKIDYRGIIATSSDERGVDATAPTKAIFDAYAKDLPNLRKFGDYPSADAVRKLFTQGALEEKSWPDKLTDGSQLIIDEARAASPGDPLYLLAWGPLHDIARALYEAPDIVPNVRVYSIYGEGQDDKNPQAFEWMNRAIANDPDYAKLFWINAEDTFRGMYASASGSNSPNPNVQWVEDNVKGQGALGDLFYDKFTFDLYYEGTTHGLKMGDTPSLLYLLDDVSNDNPRLSSWGGSFAKTGVGENTWGDRSDAPLGKYDGAATVFQHRDAAWGDFAERLKIAAGEYSPSVSQNVDSESDQDQSTDDGSDSGSIRPSLATSFEDFGTNAGSVYKGDPDTDSFHGLGGDDSILGRGGDDILVGGAGDDFVKGGAGEDILIYVADDNDGSSDRYFGSKGNDILQLQVNDTLRNSAEFVEDVAELVAFLVRNADSEVDGGPTFTFSSFDLAVRSIENFEFIGMGDDAIVDTPPPPPPPPPNVPNVPPMMDDFDIVPLPVFPETGTNAGERIPGSQGIDFLNALAGDDTILGRRGDDTLAGGAGDDFITAGADDDRLIYIVEDNIGDSDRYQGSSGFDTLDIYITADTLASSNVAAEIVQLEAFAADNFDLDINGGESFNFSAFDLEVQSIEEVNLLIYELG